MIKRIEAAKHAVDREPLLLPFGFKGEYLTELWQSMVYLRDASGASGIGVGVQSILWSDADVLSGFGERKGNEIMSAMTNFALKKANTISFETPIELMEQLLPDVYEYGKQISGLPLLRKTFALNALVALDQAAWALYAQEKGSPRFIDLVPETYHHTLNAKHTRLASIPLIGYALSESDITKLLQDGHFLLKIKIGADPDKDDDPDKMLAWDQQRLETIHRIAGDYGSEYSDNGKILYYLDANGRYKEKDRLLRLLEHADRIGALDQIVLFEEPFMEGYKIDVSDIPVRFAADESIHNAQDALESIDLGYGAFALKPVAKTMSMSLQIAKLASERGVPCFCADLTANPLLVDWNKNLAAHLPSLPGLKIGAFETNGNQYYTGWAELLKRHSCSGASWIEPNRGMFTLDDEFYEKNGGALTRSPYYESRFDKQL